MEALHLLTLILALLGLIVLWLGLRSLRRRKITRGVFDCSMSMVFFLLAMLFASLSFATHGYRTLTHEALAATLELEPLTDTRFSARVVYPDGRSKEYQLSGDQIYIDAKIIKWHPIGNLLGLHTEYELDRLSGRYQSLDDERHKPRTLHSLSDAKRIDAPSLLERFPILRLLFDTEYGSASYVPADQAVRLEVRVSTSGLLIRRVSE